MASFIEKVTLRPDGQALTGDLAGKAVTFRYQSGHTLRQNWLDDRTVRWQGIDGPLAGYAQDENYRAFKIAPGIYFITWMEESTSTVSDGDQRLGPWLTTVIMDFNTLKATASWTGPNDAHGVEFILDQADMTMDAEHRAALTR